MGKKRIRYNLDTISKEEKWKIDRDHLEQYSCLQVTYSRILSEQTRVKMTNWLNHRIDNFSLISCRELSFHTIRLKTHFLNDWAVMLRLDGYKWVFIYLHTSSSLSIWLWHAVEVWFWWQKQCRLISMALHQNTNRDD